MKRLRAGERPVQERLEVRLLGGFELADARGGALRLGTRKAEALLALLALPAGQPHARDKVCALLWPDVRDSQARHSLRQTLLQVRKTLAPNPAALVSDPRCLQLAAANVGVDVARFEASVALGTRESLLEAWRCYRGDLLDGLGIDEAPFEHWLRCERERLRALLSQALSQLVALESGAERYAEATRACLRLVQLDPLREEAHRELMRLLVSQGRRAAALQHYRTLRGMLRDELGTEPDEQTRRLHAEIEASTGARPASEPPAAPPAVTVQPLTATTGRSLELQRLLATLPLEAASPVAVSLVVGEAGAGKTHLCDRAAAGAEARGFRVLRARCFESEQVLPLAPWAQLLRSAIDRRTPLTAERRAELATLVPELAAEDAGRSPDARRLFHAVHELITSLAEPAPLLVVLEDVHWADDMSARLLSYLGRQERRGRTLLLVTAREEDLPAGSFIRSALDELAREQALARIELAPLSSEDTRELAVRLAESHALPPLGAALLERIWTISEGNPLVVVESIRALACGTLAGDVTRLPVPERVRTLILSRVAKVSAGAREVLAVAAVAGRALDLETLLVALGELPLSAALDELAGAQLVRAQDDRIYFTHDRIRETLYREMLPMRRRLLHRRVARALEQHGDARAHAELGHIGYHYSNAGDAPAAVRYLVRFADQAWRDHAVNEALAALERAYTDAARLPEIERDKAAIDIVTRQAPCLASLGRFAEIVARLSAHAPRLEQLDAPELAGPFHFFWAFSLALMAERREAEAHAQRALAYAVRCGDARVTGYTHALPSYLCQLTGRYQVGVRHGVRATELLERCASSPEAAAIAWLSLGLNQLWLGDPRAALQASDKAAAIARAADHLRGQALAATAAGCVYCYTEQWSSALEVTQQALQASKDPFTLVSAAWMAAWAQSGSGQTAEATALLTHVIEQLAEHGMRAWSGHAMTILADAQLRAGDPARAAQLAREAREVADATDDRACVGWALRVHGRAVFALGRPREARECFDRSVQLFEALEAPLDIAKGLVERCALSLAEGAFDSARRDLERARCLFIACGVDAAMGGIDRLEAGMARHVVASV